MITEYYKLSGIDKVAVLFSVIGESVAVRLLKTLSESDIRRIRPMYKFLQSNPKRYLLNVEFNLSKINY